MFYELSNPSYFQEDDKNVPQFNQNYQEYPVDDEYISVFGNIQEIDNNFPQENNQNCSNSTQQINQFQLNQTAEYQKSEILEENSQNQSQNHTLNQTQDNQITQIQQETQKQKKNYENKKNKTTKNGNQINLFQKQKKKYKNEKNEITKNGARVFEDIIKKSNYEEYEDQFVKNYIDKNIYYDEFCIKYFKNNKNNKNELKVTKQKIERINNIKEDEEYYQEAKFFRILVIENFDDLLLKHLHNKTENQINILTDWCYDFLIKNFIEYYIK